MNKKIIFLLCVTLSISIYGCSKQNTFAEDETAIETDIETTVEEDVETDIGHEADVIDVNDEDANDQVADNMVNADSIEYIQDVNSVIGGYSIAVGWLLNPNAGPVYWNETYDEYNKYISRNLLSDTIDKYWASGGIDVSDAGMHEVEYNKRFVFKYPQYVYDDEYMGYIPDIDISGKSDCSLTYDEFINQFHNFDNFEFGTFITYRITKDGDYIISDLGHSGFAQNPDEIVEHMVNSIYLPDYSLFPGNSNDPNESRVIILEHYEDDQVQTIYECHLNENNQIDSIDVYN